MVSLIKNKLKKLNKLNKIFKNQNIGTSLKLMKKDKKLLLMKKTIFVNFKLKDKRQV